MRLGVDVGGTFTDLIVDDGEQLRAAKVPSTPHDQADGVMAGLDRLGLDASHLRRFAHGTTVATNTLLERDGARTVLVVTAGFRDLLEIGRQDRPSLYDLGVDRPPPLVPRGLVVEAAERLSADGTVLTPLGDADAVAAAVVDLEPEAVAVCLLFSFLDDRHERALVDALGTRAPDLPVSRSSDVLPVFREYERANTTALNAYVAPRLGRYLATLEAALGDRGMSCGLEVMRSAGGTFAATVASRYPVHTLLSGPAAGAFGAAACGQTAGHGDLVAFDMGGTSTDVTLIEAGRPTTTSQGAIAGLPFAVTTTDIHTVGAGGGSVAWRDPGGSLRVGPRSAGADPGPAAYGRGGTEPTVTDAHVVLGRLDPDAHLGGTLQLDADAAHDAVGRLAARLGLSVRDCADGIVRVADATMVRALRVVSVERGKDPRRYALVAFGGAGPLHQGALARELGCSLVIVPPHAGVLAALGLLAAPTTAEAVRTRLAGLDELATDELAGAFAALEHQATAALAEQDVAAEQLTRRADCRYRGQSHELEVAVGDPHPQALATTFHDAHRERYGYAQPGEPVEVVTVRVHAEGPTPPLPLSEIGHGDGPDAAQLGARPVVIDRRPRTCPVYARDRLGRGDRLQGPAVVAGVDTTCLLLPGQVAEVDRFGSLLIRG
ncbi:MAG: hydantoinase/oxoprolinase family protein [Actinomycetota bacterium]|nr:hydantoinase/oxoprolinase family protein [Actinomycetota bacterium]